MYTFAETVHNFIEVKIMNITINADTEFNINNLTELPRLKIIMESLKMKINKSKLARDFGVDRRTIERYLNGFVPSKKRERSSKIDEYYEVIQLLLSEETPQQFYYMRVLRQYLKDNHGLDCAQSHFRAYIAKHEAFNDYFKKHQAIPSPKGVARFETAPGIQAQLDWKENIQYLTKGGETIEVNVAVLILSHSRLRLFHMSTSKSQAILKHFLTESFERLGGVPKELLTDNMKTVMDIARTEYSKSKINGKFEQFAQDFGFKVKPCVAGRPRTKGKVETTMKILDEIHAYQGQLSIEGLHALITKMNERVNHQMHQGTGRVPLLEYKKEKNHLLQLPTDTVRDSYKVIHSTVKVNASNMIHYKSNQYSVPSEYAGKRVQIQVYDQHIYVYYNMNLIACHAISHAKLNYQDAHYIEALTQTTPHYPEID